MLSGLKLHWSPIDAVCAALIASFSTYLIRRTHSQLPMLIYAIGLVIAAAFVYQTGSELTARRKGRCSRSPLNPSRSR